jgi:hypothetical protein
LIACLRIGDGAMFDGDFIGFAPSASDVLA